MIADYEGTVLLVSHDRDFIDRLVTSTILLDGMGGVFEYPAATPTPASSTRPGASNRPPMPDQKPARAGKEKNSKSKLTYAEKPAG